MIKGINKRIIEVNDTGSDYFEKVLFIVKDNKADLRNLHLEADRVVNAYFPNNSIFLKDGYLRKRMRKRKFLTLFASILSVVVISVAILLFKYL